MRQTHQCSLTCGHQALGHCYQRAEQYRDQTETLQVSGVDNNQNYANIHEVLINKCEEQVGQLVNKQHWQKQGPLVVRTNSKLSRHERTSLATSVECKTC